MNYSLETLEFHRLVDLLIGLTQTEMGRKMMLDLQPMTDRIGLERELSGISETILLNEEKQVSWSFSGMQDPNYALAVLKIRNASLEPERMLEIVRLCEQALFARSLIHPEKEFAATLWNIVEDIPPNLLGTLDNVKRKILPGGEIDDSASPELGQIRRELNAQRSRLAHSLETVMRSAGDSIQDQIVTLRNDRYVIPIKADLRGKVRGVAHGFSSSGQTVFIEPLEAIEANNELQNIKGKEEREISRILFDLTESLRDQLPAIEKAADAVGKLDFIRAKVEFARRFKAIVPELSNEGSLYLADARHPLLEENLRNQLAANGKQPSDSDQTDEIVPSSFSLDAKRSVMIISGANAGGKTVVLKTAGLLSLMAISGLPVPAKQAKVPFYRSVLADIGDHQSLSANLSTFSSHMSNIAEMMRDCIQPSLVLLDEVGTGTDPEEGSALGVAIVDHFRQKGAQVIASTHYRGLKIYAANDPDVINASVEFDEKTLQPTYRLLIGLAGASSGIQIASRFGILPEVIDKARQNLDVSAQEAEAYLLKLQTETKQAEDLRIALEEEREATALKYAGLEVEALRKEKIRQKEFEQKLAEALESFERQSKAFIDTIEDKALKNKLDKERSARKAELNRAILSKLNEVNSSVSDPESSISSERPSDINIPIKVGSKVTTSLGKAGIVEKIDKEIAEVLVGNIRMREKLSDLRTIFTPETKQRTSSTEKRKSTPNLRPDNLEAPAELNLIGKTTADAEYELDRFIDEAYMASLPRIRIIHGFGTGALKNYVHHFLKHHELIERFAFAPSSQGGNGATIAELKM
ncbi:endonuclease MutS2 [Leptolyngbya sp. 7M]|uniref:endonuclease MutS2 n=1 Tax=Leptolyngbya sp. 7M TaxID=2812896 RepID=UPI001B8D8841|nr:endonuclease MutS2 [Leptolyngbya sp. 7M]QYO65884.1 endonuclease MutS2 [Leptolyngbya sp. 7M]